jgi:hypothetical protein
MPIHSFDRSLEDPTVRRHPAQYGPAGTVEMDSLYPKQELDIHEGLCRAAFSSSSSPARGRPVVHPVLAVQRRYGNRAAGRYAACLAKGNLTGLPDDLKTGIEALSGFSLDEVRVHYNSAKPADLKALAYTQGKEIHVAPGQEKHLPHEAWHAVQQMQGRVKPSVRSNGALINNEPGLEKEADLMGAKALQVVQRSDPAATTSWPLLGVQSGSSTGSSPAAFAPGVVQRFEWSDIASLLPTIGLGFLSSYFEFGLLSSIGFGLAAPYLIGYLLSFIISPREQDEQIDGRGTGAEALYQAAELIAEAFRSKSTLAIGKVGNEWVVAAQSNTVPPEIRLAMSQFKIKSIKGVTKTNDKPVSKAHIHAEMKILGYAKQQNETISWIYLSRKPCPGCHADLNSENIDVRSLTPGPQPQSARSNYDEYDYEAS